MGMDLEHNFLGSAGAQERPWQRPQRSMGGHRGLQGHFGRQGGVRFLKVKPKPNVIFFKVGVRGGGTERRQLGHLPGPTIYFVHNSTQIINAGYPSN